MAASLRALFFHVNRMSSLLYFPRRQGFRRDPAQSLQGIGGRSGIQRVFRLMAALSRVK